MSLRSHAHLTATAARLMCIAAVVSAAAFPAASVSTARDLPPVAALAQGGAVADFDGDHKLDFALSIFQRQEGGSRIYSVQIHLSRNAQASSFEIATGHPPHISSRDVDNDHDVDLVVSTFGGERLGVWLNDGRGGFSKSDAVVYPESIWHEPPVLVPSAGDRHDDCACPTAGCPDRELRFSPHRQEESVRPPHGARAVSPLDFLTYRIRPPPSPAFFI